MVSIVDQAFVLYMCCSLDPSGQIFFSLSISHRALSNSNTHTRTVSSIVPGLPDYDLIPGKGREKSPDRLICVLSSYRDQRPEGGCLMPEVIE